MCFLVSDVYMMVNIEGAEGHNFISTRNSLLDDQIPLLTHPSPGSSLIIRQQRSTSESKVLI